MAPILKKKKKVTKKTTKKNIVEEAPKIEEDLEPKQEIETEDDEEDEEAGNNITSEVKPENEDEMETEEFEDPEQKQKKTGHPGILIQATLHLRVSSSVRPQNTRGKHLRKLETETNVSVEMYCSEHIVSGGPLSLATYSKAKASGGKWDTFQREVQQKKTVKGKKERSKHVNTESSKLMNMIFR